MALQISAKREFYYKPDKNAKPVLLDDPNNNWSPEIVMDFYSNSYPELTNGNIEGPDLGDDDQIMYTFSFTPKTKG